MSNVEYGAIRNSSNGHSRFSYEELGGGAWRIDCHESLEFSMSADMYMYSCFQGLLGLSLTVKDAGRSLENSIAEIGNAAQVMGVGVISVVNVLRFLHR